MGDKVLMKDKSDPNHEEYARRVERFEAEYGGDWDGTFVEYDSDFVSLPFYLFKAACQGNIRTVLQWLGRGDIKKRVNAKCVNGGNEGLLYLAASKNNQLHDLMSYLLLNGADANAQGSLGASVLSLICWEECNQSQAVSLLLGWGAELFCGGKQMTTEEKLEMCDDLSRNANTAAVAELLSPELGGRRCEVISTPNTRDDLVGKTCVVEEYIKAPARYKVRMEFTNEVLLLDADNLKRRDRTPQDPGYYVENKKSRLIRRDFESDEECQAFIANLSAQKEKRLEIDPNAEAKAEQAAADFLAELGLDDLEGPSIEESNKKTSGKKKKRGVKKKRRK